MDKISKRKIYFSIFIPTIICILVGLVYVFEYGMDYNFSKLGIFPRNIRTLPHIFSMPFIHSNLEHLFSNILTFFVLSSFLYYFYKEIANKTLLLSVIISGILLWLIGRESWHIGLSGVVYSLISFLFFSGIIRKHIPLIAISLIVVFLYGNNIWHVFPWERYDPISWEGHLAGVISGVLLSIVYKNRGPQKPTDIWENEDNCEDEIEEWWKEDFDNNIDEINSNPTQQIE